MVEVKVKKNIYRSTEITPVSLIRGKLGEEEFFGPKFKSHWISVGQEWGFNPIFSRHKKWTPPYVKYIRFKSEKDFFLYILTFTDDLIF